MSIIIYTNHDSMFRLPRGALPFILFFNTYIRIWGRDVWLKRLNITLTLGSIDIFFLDYSITPLKQCQDLPPIPPPSKEEKKDVENKEKSEQVEDESQDEIQPRENWNHIYLIKNCYILFVK